MANSDWTRDEVEATVADYFAMLEADLRGESYSKVEHNRRLQQVIARSKGSIEFKHQNISAVLINFRQPFIAGYLPRQNYQMLLEQAVLEWLAADPRFLGAADAGDRVGATPRFYRLDFVRRDAENRRLGRMGEEWVVEFEQRRLHDEERRPDLAHKVEWIADTRGDGAGYDIASFNADATSRLIEVKTTGLGKYFPFLVTANEVQVSERESEAYQLYRVFDFSSQPRLYVLPGSLKSSCRLEPTQYQARVGPAL